MNCIRKRCTNHSWVLFIFLTQFGVRVLKNHFRISRFSCNCTNRIWKIWTEDEWPLCYQQLWCIFYCNLIYFQSINNNPINTKSLVFGPKWIHSMHNILALFDVSKHCLQKPENSRTVFNFTKAVYFLRSKT